MTAALSRDTREAKLGNLKLHGCRTVLLHVQMKVWTEILSVSFSYHVLVIRISVCVGHLRQERPPHLHPDLLHPALRERGRAIPQSHIVPRIVERDGRVSQYTAVTHRTQNSGERWPGKSVYHSHTSYPE
jgi:hypothetical protein